MFTDCSSLESLPDISRWDTSKATGISQIFSYCTSLKSLPDISRWNTSSVTSMNDMFLGMNITIPNNIKNKFNC